MVNTLEEARYRTEVVKASALTALDSLRQIIEGQREDPLTPARLRGIESQKQRLKSDDYRIAVISDREAAYLLGITPEEVEKQRRDYKLLGLDFGSGDFLYPRFQFADGGKLRGLEEILAALSEATKSPHMMTQFFFIEMYGLPDKVTPYRHLMRGGDVQQVVQIAENYLEQGWNS